MTQSRATEQREKLLTLLRLMTPRQFEWIQGLQRHVFNPVEPEKDAWAFVVEALTTGIRSSTARLLIEDRLRANGIEFSAMKLNAQAYGAKAHWDNLGKSSQPALSPLIQPPTSPQEDAGR